MMCQSKVRTNKHYSSILKLNKIEKSGGLETLIDHNSISNNRRELKIPPLYLKF